LAEGVPGDVEEIELLLEPEIAELTVAQIIQSGAHFVQIALDQVFGADPAVTVKSRIGDVAEIAVQTLMEMKNQLVDVVALAGLADLPQAVADQLVIVMR